MGRLLRFALLLLPAVSLALLVSAAMSSRRATAYSDMPPARRTGAPTENTCATCHGGGLNDGQGTLTIVDVPAEYLPGQTYTISVTLARPGSTRWGFELTCLQTSTSSAAGAITNTTGFTGTQLSSGKTYISQTTVGADGTFAGTADGPVTWSFQWTAPIAGTGEVRFYAAGVAADNSDDADGGDFVYTDSKASAEGAPIGVEEMTWGAIKAMYH